MAINNTNQSRTNVTVNDGLDSFSAEPVETMEIVKGTLLSTNVIDTENGQITEYNYSPDVVIRKIDGVEVSRTNIGGTQ